MDGPDTPRLASHSNHNKMNDTRTSSMLQRLPVILAVTAASYGLQIPAHAARPGSAASGQDRTILQVGGTRQVATGTAKRRP